MRCFCTISEEVFLICMLVNRFVRLERRTIIFRLVLALFHIGTNRFIVDRREKVLGSYTMQKHISILSSLCFYKWGCFVFIFFVSFSL